MQTIELSMPALMDKYLNNIEENWQPTDFLPDSASPTFYEEVKEIQALAQELPYDLFAT